MKIEKKSCKKFSTHAKAKDAISETDTMKSLESTEASNPLLS
jgi:hypothetical protein